MNENTVSKIISDLKGNRKRAVELLDAKQMPNSFWSKLAEGEFGEAASILSDSFPHLDNLADMIWEG